MSTNLLQFPEFPSGKSTRQEEFEDLYMKKGIDFDELIREAHQKTLLDAQNKPPHYKGRAYMATTMNWNLTGLLRETFGDEIAYDENGRPYFRLSDTTRLYFKKLDQKYRPSNIPTRHVRLLNTAQGNLFGSSTTVLYVGCRLREEKQWEQIDSFMVEMNGLKSVAWVSNLGDLGASMWKHTTPVVPVTPSAPGSGIYVGLKRTGEQDTATGTDTAQ